MRWLPPIVFTLMLGCFQSHGRSEVIPTRDAGVARRDARPPFRRDAGPDGGAGCTLEVLDRLEVAWPDVDCGQAGSPRVVPLSLSSETFVLVIGEERTCRDRPPLVFMSSLAVSSGTLVAGPRTTLGVFRDGELHAASFGADLGVCAGRTLFTGRPGFVREVELRPAPPSFPDCVQRTHCTGIAADGRGWTVAWSFFECDVQLGELGRWSIGGDPDSDILRTDERPVDVTRTRSGAAAVSRPRGTDPRATIYDWPRAESMPIANTIRFDTAFERAPIAIASSGDGDEHALVVAGQNTIRLVVIGADGRVRFEREHAMLDMPGFEPLNVDAVVTGFGLLVAVSYGWTGGGIRTATRVIALDHEGDLLRAPFETEHEHEVWAPIVVDVAWDGAHGLIHRILAEGSTEAILLGCR